MNPPWLDFNSPSKGSMHDSPGVRFGAWGTGETNKKTYKFVLAGTKSPRSGEESASDGEEEDDGTDAATLRKQLKARIRSERSMRNAKRKVDMMLSELRKVGLRHDELLPTVTSTHLFNLCSCIVLYVGVKW